jgi:hypothetical protein
MVITVEPGKQFRAVGDLQFASVIHLLTWGSTGVYVPSSPSFPKQFHNIGIRIEVCPSIRLLFSL